MNHNLFLYSCFAVIAIFLLWITISMLKKPLFKTVEGKILFGVCILALTLTSWEIIRTTQKAEIILQPFKENFVARVADFKNSLTDPNASRISYDGKLDTIIRFRNDVLSYEGITGVFVEWRSYENVATFQGLYMHKWIVCMLMGVWLIALAFLDWMKPKETAIPVTHKLTIPPPPPSSSW